MATKALPCPTLLRQLLTYDPETGGLIWRRRPASMFSDGLHSAAHIAARWNKIWAGNSAFTCVNNGYHCGHIFSRRVQAHWVVWALVHGEWPTREIDHIDGNPTNNRIVNLRNVSHEENMRNRVRSKSNTSGVTGVQWHKKSGKWRAVIKVGGRAISLGCFASFDDAVNRRKAAEYQYSYHPNHDRAALLSAEQPSTNDKPG